MKYIVHVEHYNGKATNPCGHIYIKLFPPSLDKLGARCSATLLVKLLCL